MPASTAARAMLLGALAIVGAATLPSIGSGESAGPADGRAMVDTRDSRLSGGPIALQYGAGTVMFRNVRIRERT